MGSTGDGDWFGFRKVLIQSKKESRLGLPAGALFSAIAIFCGVTAPSKGSASTITLSVLSLTISV